MELRSKRVLLTGATGFTGRYVSDELAAAGCEVISLGMQQSSGGIQLQADLRDPEALAQVRGLRPQVVIHLAALAFVAHGRANDFYDINLKGTRNLLEALAASGAPLESVLLASSANVYGNASTELIDESVTPAPANDYAVSKLAMEYMAWLWRDRLPVIVTRPFNYTGVGQAENFLIPKIVAHFRRREPVIELGNLDVARDFSDVRFIARAYRALVGTPAAIGETINVCSGEVHSLREIIAMCEQITGHRIEVQVNPDFVRANEVKILRGDCSRLRRLVGPLEHPALQRTLEWMLAA